MSSNSMSLISEISFKFLFLSVQVWECPLHSDGLCERTTFGDTRWRSSSIWGWGYKEQYIAKYFLVQVGPLLTFVDENRVTVAVNNTLSRWFHAPVIVFNKYSSSPSRSPSINHLYQHYLILSPVVRFTVPQGEVRWQPESPKWDFLLSICCLLPYPWSWWAE